MNTLTWCKKQKNGIKLIDPNDNLCEEYLKKAENALKAVRSLEDNTEWQISSAYYAMYFSLYAILMKIGIKCEIHSCTLEIMKQVLSKYFTKEDISLLEKSLTTRVDVQYYVDRIIDITIKNQMIREASSFHLKCKEIISKINQTEINNIREMLF